MRKAVSIIIILTLMLKFTPCTPNVRIIPAEKEFILPANGTFFLDCFGTDPVKWKIPSNSEDQLRIIKTHSEINEHYKSTLTVNNVNYLDAGYYYCTSITSGGEYEEAKIYLYVRDINHLLVSSESNLLQSEFEHEPFLIPCRPSFNEVNVTLWNEHMELVNEFSFDPYFGFIVNDPQLTDSGIYTCKAFLPGVPEQELSVEVFVSPKTNEIKRPKIVLHGEKIGSHVMVGQNVVLECSVTVSLGVHIYFGWITPLKEELEHKSARRTNTSNIKINGLTVRLSKTILTLKNVTKDFEGTYTCTVTDNSNNTKKDDYFLKVHSEDTSFLNLSMEGSRIVTVRGEGKTTEWEVKIMAHPQPQIIWIDPYGNKLPSDSKKYEIIHQFNSSKVIIKETRLRDSGLYEIQVENAVGKKSLKVNLKVEDIPQVLVILDKMYIKKEKYFPKCIVLAEPIATVSLTFTPCNDSKCDHSKRKNMIVSQQNTTMVTKEYYGQILAKEDGIIACNATNKYGSANNFSYFRVTDATPPIFLEKDIKENNKNLVVPVGQLVRWKCRATGLPPPTIIWYKDGYELKSNQTGLIIRDKNETLIIPIRGKEDDGIYICAAKNIAGTIQTQYTLKLKTVLVPWYWSVVGGVILVLITIIVVVFLLRKVRHEKKLREKLTAAGLSYFQDGQIESLNPDLNIGEQADLLPYDKKWEIPREKIKLGIQLGSGAFGVVMKAEVSGLREGEPNSVVAVKMAKKNSDVSLVKALVSELKIMSHLGQHLNVVNLLGACTSGIYAGEVLVLVEYCRFGNLHNYLLKHRDKFVNQVNPHSGNLDLSERFDDNRSVSTYVANNSVLYGMGSDGGLQSVNTEITTWYGTPSIGEPDQSQHPQTPEGEDGYLISRPFRGAETSSKPITTKDLMCWCYQVARGMEYLASRKVLHGDLATRNILLAEGNIAKICDFGFSKSMYQDENYTKKGNDPLPLKWLSIEALRDRVFSTQSDIWAYGVVLWEMFSLAKTPYPGKQFDQQLFDRLLEGYRMEKPDFATEDIYNLMLECWKEQPMLRPSFTECADRLGNMLEESVIQHYMELNDPYIQFNAQVAGNDDLFSKINCPTYSNFCGAVTPEPENHGNYLNMSKSQEDAIEMRPMIQHGVKCFLNPGYEGLNKVVVCAQINRLPQNESNTFQ